MKYMDDDFIAEFEGLSHEIEEILEGVSEEMTRDVLCVRMADAIYDVSMNAEEAIKKLQEWTDVMKESMILMYDQAKAVNEFEKETGLDKFLRGEKS